MAAATISFKAGKKASTSSFSTLKPDTTGTQRPLFRTWPRTSARLPAGASTSSQRDDFDFHQRVLRQARDLDGRARGRRACEVLRVDLVHLGKVVHRFQKDRRLDDRIETRAASLENGSHILHHLA